MKKAEGSSPKLYFDGACPVCFREVAIYRRKPGADGIRWIDVAHCGSADLGTDLTREAALARRHLRRPRGSLVSGAQAFVALRQALPRWSWLGRFLGSRLAIWLLESGYGAFLVGRRAVRGGPTVTELPKAPDSDGGDTPVAGPAMEGLLSRGPMPAATVAALRRALLDCQRDEVAHRVEAAVAHGTAAPGWLLRRWVWLVDAGSRAAVTVCRHV